MRESPESFVDTEIAGLRWQRRQPRHEDGHLLAHTQNWLNAMPRGVRPVHLQENFPRIANEMSRLWGRITALDRYFEELECSPRAERTGFPPVIKEELLAMHLFALRHRAGRYRDHPPPQALDRPDGAPMTFQVV